MARKPSSESSFALQPQTTVCFGATQSTVLPAAGTLVVEVFTGYKELCGAATVRRQMLHA